MSCFWVLAVLTRNDVSPLDVFVNVEFVLTGDAGFGESRSTWNIKNIRPNNAGPKPLHKPRIPVIIPWTAPTVDKYDLHNFQ